MERYPHLKQLKAADLAQSLEVLSPEVLIGCDYYWHVVTGKIVKGNRGPVALQTQLG
jgi:hypothetical protein